MNTINRFIVVFLSLLLAGAGAGLILLAWLDDQFLDLKFDNFSLQAEIISEGLARTVFTIVCGAIIALGLLFIALQFLPGGRGKRKEQAVRLRQTSGDEVEMSTSTIENMLRQELEMLPEVKQAAVSVRKDKNGLGTVLDLNLFADATVAHVTSEASHLVISSVRERLGLQSVQRPLIRVHYDELNLGQRQPATPATTSYALPSRPLEEDLAPASRAQREATAPEIVTQPVVLVPGAELAEPLPAPEPPLEASVGDEGGAVQEQTPEDAERPPDRTPPEA